MKLIVLRTGDAAPPVAARRGEFFGWIQRETASAWSGGWEEHDVREVERPLPEPGAAAGFVITGSSSSVTERAPWMLRTEELIRRIIAARVPLFGICFGHQMIAEALGGKVTKNPRGREIGTIEVRLTEGAADPILDGLPPVFTANATHVDSVTTLPPGARVLATSEREPNAIYVVGETTKCVQFHPEIDGDAMRGYIEARTPLIEAEGLDARSLHAGAVDTPHGAGTLRNFAHFVGRR